MLLTIDFSTFLQNHGQLIYNSVAFLTLYTSTVWEFLTIEKFAPLSRTTWAICKKKYKFGVIYKNKNTMNWQGKEKLTIDYFVMHQLVNHCK